MSNFLYRKVHLSFLSLSVTVQVQKLDASTQNALF